MGTLKPKNIDFALFFDTIIITDDYLHKGSLLKRNCLGKVKCPSKGGAAWALFWKASLRSDKNDSTNTSPIG